MRACRLVLLAVASLALVLAGLAPVSPAIAAAGTCLGLPVTIDGTDVGRIRGTNGDDVIQAGPGTIRIDGDFGNDVICAYNTTTLVEGDQGVDYISIVPNPTLAPGAIARSIKVDGGRAKDRFIVSMTTGTNVQIVGDGIDVLYADTVLAPGQDWRVFPNRSIGSVRIGDDYVVRTRRVRSFQISVPNARKVEVVSSALADDLVSLDAQGTAKVKVDLGRGDDALTVRACRGVLKGGEGRDVIRAIAADPAFCDSSRGLRVKGAGGRDRLYGTVRADTLLGGKGRDTAVGGPGKDRCQAEKTKSCER